MKIFVKIAGVKLALLTAVLIVIASGKLADASKGILIFGVPPTAMDFLRISIGLVDTTTKAVQDKITGLSYDFEKLEQRKKDDDELFKAAKDFLGDNIRLDPFIIFGESPNDYYNRTVHSGNIGILSVEYIHNYVDVALTLPTIDQTIGDINNG